MHQNRGDFQPIGRCSLPMGCGTRVAWNLPPRAESGAALNDEDDSGFPWWPGFSGLRNC
jgi:hypothetical protein